MRFIPVKIIILCPNKDTNGYSGSYRARILTKDGRVIELEEKQWRKIFYAYRWQLKKRGISLGSIPLLSIGQQEKLLNELFKEKEKEITLEQPTRLSLENKQEIDKFIRKLIEHDKLFVLRKNGSIHYRLNIRDDLFIFWLQVNFRKGGISLFIEAQRKNNDTLFYWYTKDDRFKQWIRFDRLSQAKISMTIKKLLENLEKSIGIVKARIYEKLTLDDIERYVSHFYLPIGVTKLLEHPVRIGKNTRIEVLDFVLQLLASEHYGKFTREQLKRFAGFILLN